MIYKISDYFKKSFYYLINDDYDTDNINEIEIKLKVDKNEHDRYCIQIKWYNIFDDILEHMNKKYLQVQKEEV